jgi:hypothetical protein
MGELENRRLQALRPELVCILGVSLNFSLFLSLSHLHSHFPLLHHCHMCKCMFYVLYFFVVFIHVCSPQLATAVLQADRRCHRPRPRGGRSAPQQAAEVSGLGMCVCVFVCVCVCMCVLCVCCTYYSFIRSTNMQYILKYLNRRDEGKGKTWQLGSADTLAECASAKRCAPVDGCFPSLFVVHVDVRCKQREEEKNVFVLWIDLLELNAGFIFLIFFSKILLLLCRVLSFLSEGIPLDCF